MHGIMVLPIKLSLHLLFEVCGSAMMIWSFKNDRGNSEHVVHTLVEITLKEFSKIEEDNRVVEF